MTEEMQDEKLEALLAAYAVGEPSAALRQVIIAAAPRERAVGRVLRWAGAAALGTALVASCAAGVAAGLTLAPASLARAISGHPPVAAADVSSLADPADDPAIG